jgi:hypothetical protein
MQIPTVGDRVLQALQREGLLDRDRRMVRFQSWERMRDVADFNPRYRHMREERLGEAHLGSYLQHNIREGTYPPMPV